MSPPLFFLVGRFSWDAHTPKAKKKTYPCWDAFSTHTPKMGENVPLLSVPANGIKRVDLVSDF